MSSGGRLCYRAPPRLRPGDIIGVATPSDPVRTPRRLQRGVEAIRALGFDAVVGPVAAKPRHASREDRVAELNAFIGDASIRAIAMSIGGRSSGELLDDLDWDTLRAHPKVILGYSDITAILLAGLTIAGVVMFHGPTVLPELAEHPSLLTYTKDHLLRAVSLAEPIGAVEPAARWTDEHLEWDLSDDRPRQMSTSPGWVWIQPGEATGPLVGGNLETMCSLIGSRYWPSFTGAILVWETTSTSMTAIAPALAKVGASGVFEEIAGMIVGRSFRAPPDQEEELHRQLAVLFREYDIPVLAGVDLGHTDPMLTLPLGVLARINSRDRTLEILDAAVC